MVETARVSRKYQIVIPKTVREALNIKQGDELIVLVEDDRIVMRPKPKSYTEYMCGLYKDLWKGVEAAKYVEEERGKWV